MQGVIFEESSAWLFLLVTVLLGGWTGWMTGRAVAGTWAPAWRVALWCLPLAVAVRFIHYALFEGSFRLSHYYVVDYVVVVLIALLGWRFTRATQLTRQYGWLYERTGPLSWREKAHA